MMAGTDGASGGGRKSRLGRGLSSLLGEDEDESRQLDRLRQSRNIPVEQIEPGRYQPRRRFDEGELKELADSIREKGVLQPILLRRQSAGDGYEIIAGERRWRAAQLAQLHEVPALVREFDDDEALEIALIENLQREDLTPLEEAEAYRRLIDEHGQTQETVARAVSKSRSHVANAIRLLNLPDTVKQYLDDGGLTAGHARALLGAEDPAALAEEVVRRNLTVRDTERLVQRSRTGGASEPPPKPGPAEPPAAKTRREKDPDTLALERELSQATGLAVELDMASDQAGTLSVHYTSLDQLDDLMERLTRPIADRPLSGQEAAGVDPAPRPSTADVQEDVDFTELLAQTEAMLSRKPTDDVASMPEQDAEQDAEQDDDLVGDLEGDAEDDGDWKALANAVGQAIDGDAADAPAADDEEGEDLDFVDEDDDRDTR